MRRRSTIGIGFIRQWPKALAAFLALWLGVPPNPARDKFEAVPPGNWAAVETLPKYSPITVRMTFGDREQGLFLELANEHLLLQTDGQERLLLRSNIAEVRQMHGKGKKQRGALLGMAGGAVAGGIAARASGATFKGEDPWGVLFVSAGVGIGALIGIIAGAMNKQDRLVYRK